MTNGAVNDVTSDVLAVVAEISNSLSLMSGRALLVGGRFPAIEFLAGSRFNLDVFAVGRDLADIESCKEPIARLLGTPERFSFVADEQLPFEDGYFSVVIWAEGPRLNNMDLKSIVTVEAEIQRVLCPRGNAFVAVNRTAGADSQISIDQWIETLGADRVEYDRRSERLLLWIRSRVIGAQPNSVVDSEQAQEPPLSGSRPLYQQIYDQNSWYANADEDQCVGVQLLPDYQDWLTGAVIDLGCGRGQVVEKLVQAGFEATGMDQLPCRSDVRVGDITQPIDDMSQFSSALCIDCIEHLDDRQIAGLFENMQRTQRQAFSIRNGESADVERQLHFNRKDFIDWTKLIREYFQIASAIQIDENHVLYLTRTP